MRDEPKRCQICKCMLLGAGSNKQFCQSCAINNREWLRTMKFVNETLKKLDEKRRNQFYFAVARKLFD